MSRFALLMSFVLVACAVPTPVGELQQAGAGSGATSTTEDTSEGPVSSVSSASSSSSSAPGPTGSSTTSVPTSSSGDSVIAQMTSFAIRRGELPDEEPTDTLSSVGTGSSGDPDDLLVTFGFTSASCQDPDASDSCGTWAATLTFSPELQVAGTYTNAEVDGFFVEQGPAGKNEDCFGTGGDLTGFTIILESIDETSLEMVFEGDGFGPDGVDLNGLSLTVPRC